MRPSIASCIVFGIFWFLVLTLLAALQIHLPRFPEALLAGLCAAVVFWAESKLRSKRNPR